MYVVYIVIEYVIEYVVYVVIEHVTRKFLYLSASFLASLSASLLFQFALISPKCSTMFSYVMFSFMDRKMLETTRRLFGVLLSSRIFTNSHLPLVREPSSRQSECFWLLKKNSPILEWYLPGVGLGLLLFSWLVVLAWLVVFDCGVV